MSTHHALRRGAAPSRSGTARRPHHPLDELRRISDALDELQRDASSPATTHREVERRVAEAERLANRLRAVFRAPTPVHPVNPPKLLERRPDGSTRAAW